MRQFNADVFTAAVQYNAALAYPDGGNFQEGERRHAGAKRAYANFR
jgi:hypothetical protein